MNLYGLIGYPLGHSFSKKYFTKKFLEEGFPDCGYELFPIPSIDQFPLLLKSNSDLKGLNVTLPYKQQVLEYVTEFTAAVRAIGAANTIKITGDKLVAYNTDVMGFENSFIKNLLPTHTKALILGTGGASKAVQYVLKRLKIDFLLVSRDQPVNDAIINYQMIDERMMSNYPVIINCTPVGMTPNDQQYPPLPYEFLSEKHYLFDLVYTPEETMFLKKGKSKGAVTQNGYEMLLIQAEESWKIWNES